MKINKILLASLICFCGVSAYAQTPAQELNFFAQQAQDQDKKLLLTISDNLSSWLERNSALPYADEALFLRTDILSSINKRPETEISLLKYFYEFPKGKKIQQAKDMLPAIHKTMDKNKREDYLKATVVRHPEAETQDRLADFLTSATSLELKGSYEPLFKEFSNFSARFPAYENMDKMELLLGDLHRQNKNYKAAIMQYKKVYDIYPSNKYKAASLRMMGDIYAGELKNYTTAMEYYQKVLTDFPNSVEKGTTYNHMAILSESKKEFDAAADYAEKASEVYLENNQRQDAYDVLRYKAQIEENKKKNYTAALSTLTKINTLFAKDEPRFVDTSFEVARINGKRLKDSYAEMAAYQDIFLAYPQNERAPEALFKAGQIAEKLGDNAKAKDSYKKLIVEHPADSLANKAQRRLDSIEKAEAKAEAASMNVVPPSSPAEEAAVIDAGEEAAVGAQAGII